MENIPKQLFRYRQAGTSLEFTLSEIRGKLYCAHSSQLNDPFDGLGYVKDTFIRSAYVDAGPSTYSFDVTMYFGAACFTTNWQNPTMWAHYAGYSGVCLAYETESLMKAIEKANEDAWVLELERLGVQTNIPFSRTYLRKITYHDILPTTFKSELDALYAKSSHWSYEDEWRLVSESMEVEKKRHGVIIETSGALKQIIIGSAADDHTRMLIAQTRDEFCPSASIHQLVVVRDKAGFAMSEPIHGSTFSKSD